MRSALNRVAFKIISSVQTPIIVGRVELRCLRLENLEPETFHISYQNYRSQVWVLLRCLLNAGIPDLQNLTASFLNIRKGVIVAERKNRCIASRN